MVKITNGSNIFEVTNGAYEGIYKAQGYSVMTEKQEKKIAKDAEIVEEKEATVLEDLLEKPISQWTKADTKEFAELKGIDLSGTKNINEAKELIKASLED